MELDSLAIELRPRNHWEALDLGCLLVRRWWPILYASWLATALPVFLVLAVTLFDRPGLAVLLFWWLKPVYERAPLLILSRAIFGDVPTLRGTLGELPRALRPGMATRLTLRRLAPSRAFDTPVAVLEHLSGERRQRRLAVLQRSAGAPAFWLTVIGIHIEGFLQISLVLLGIMLIPTQVDVDWWGLLLSEETGAFDWVFNAAYFVAAGAVGPVYVASGFSLYLNRRIELEGWDIELRFRELARRVTGIAGALLIALLVVTPTPAHARAPEDAGASRDMIGDILDGDSFHQRSTTQVPRFLESWFDRDTTQPRGPMDVSWLRDAGRIVGLIAELALWIGAAILALFLVRWLNGYRPLAAGPGADAPDPAPGVRRLDLDAPELRVDPFGSARVHWAEGRHREAISLLYRAMLLRLRDHYLIGIEPGDTEGECLAKAGQVPDPVRSLLGRLTTVWLAAGYGKRLPDDAEFRGLTDGCEAALSAEAGRRA